MSETRVLLVEDNQGDANLVKILLHEATEMSFKVDHVETLETGTDHLNQKKYDVILLDLNLPDSSGLGTIKKVIHMDVPVIIITSLSDRDTAIEALKLGAQDYVEKNDLSNRNLTRSILYAIERFVKIKAEKDMLAFIKDNLANALSKLDKMVKVNG